MNYHIYTHTHMHAHTYISYIPFTQGTRKKNFKNLPPGLQGIVALIKSKASGMRKNTLYSLLSVHIK